MWVSKKKWQILEKRVADLELYVQSQLEVKINESAIQKALQRLEANRDSGAVRQD